MDDPFNTWIEDLVAPISSSGYFITTVIYGIPDGTCCYCAPREQKNNSQYQGYTKTVIPTVGYSHVYDFMLNVGKRIASNPPYSSAYKNGVYSQCADKVLLGLIEDFVEKIDGLPCIIWCYGKGDECIFARGGIMDLSYTAIKTCATMENYNGGPIFKVNMN